MLFSYFGYRKLAHFVEQEIKRDLLQAKNERAIPLAGSEAEQKRVNSLKPRTPATGDGTWKGTVTHDGRQGRTAEDPRAQVREAPVADTSNDQRADNGRITLKSIGAGGREESVTIDILRPAIPSAVIALMTRKDTGDRPSQMGDVVADEVGGGLVALSSITPSGVESGHDPAGHSAKPQPLLHGADQGRATRCRSRGGRTIFLGRASIPRSSSSLPRRHSGCRARPGRDRRAAEESSHLGRSLRPIRKRSMACAAWRPSRIAHTTRLCPRRMSPAAKTFWLPLMR